MTMKSEEEEKSEGKRLRETKEKSNKESVVISSINYLTQYHSDII